MGAAECTATREICLGIYTMLIAMVTESLMKCRHYVQRCLVFVLSCLSHTHSFLLPNPGAFMDGRLAGRTVSANYLKRLPKPWDPWARLVPCLLEGAFSTGSSSPAVMHLPQVLLSPSRVPGHFREWGEVLQQYLKVTAVEKEHQDLTPASPGMQGVTAMGWDVLSSECGGGLSAGADGGVSKLWTSTHPLLLYTKHFLFKQPHARVIQDGSSSSCGHIWP